MSYLHCLIWFLCGIAVGGLTIHFVLAPKIKEMREVTGHLLCSVTKKWIDLQKKYPHEFDEKDAMPADLIMMFSKES